MIGEACRYMPQVQIQIMNLIKIWLLTNYRSYDYTKEVLDYFDWYCQNVLDSLDSKVFGMGIG